MLQHACSIEPLEARIAPAGLVKITLSGGAVTITGDAENNQIIITPIAPGELEISAGGTTQLQFGNAPTSSSVQVVGYSKDLKVALGIGNDDVTLAAGLYLKSVVLDGGEGNNRFTFADLGIPGSFSILAKSGNDTVSATGDLIVSRDYSVKLGNGFNTVTSNLGRFGVGGNFNLLGGTGSDDFAFNSTDSAIGGNAILNTGQNIDILTFRATNDLGITGKLTVSGAEKSAASGSVMAGATNSNFSVGADNEFGVRGDVSFTTKNASSGIVFGGINSTTLTGKLTVKTGDSSTITVVGKGQYIAGNVSFKTKGDTSLTIQPATGYFMAGKFSYSGDGGVDKINMLADGIIVGSATFNLGAGAGQTLSFGGASEDSATVLGALGIKQASKDAATASTTSLARIVVGGKFSLSTGASADRVTMDDFTFRSTSSIATGAGSDTLLVETLGLPNASQFTGALKATLGDGDDRATFGVSGTGNSVVFAVASTLDAGPGADPVQKISPLLTVTNAEA